MQRRLVGCSPWGHKELDTTEVTEQQQQQEGIVKEFGMDMYTLLYLK